MTEIWKSIPDEPFYQASSLGRIRRIAGSPRCRKHRILRPRTRKIKRPGQIAYRDVQLCSNGKPRMETVHKLVALAFHGPKPSPDHEIRHCDSDPGNNRPSNVKWATIAQNKADYIQNGKSARDMTRALAARHPSNF